MTETFLLTSGINTSSLESKRFSKINAFLFSRSQFQIFPQHKQEYFLLWIKKPGVSMDSFLSEPALVDRETLKKLQGVTYSHAQSPQENSLIQKPEGLIIIYFFDYTTR